MGRPGKRGSEVVRAAGFYFWEEGKVFLPMGDCWAGLWPGFVPKIREGEPLPRDAERRCFDFLRSLLRRGLNAIRTFPAEWVTFPEAEPLDAVGKVNLALLRRWERFFRMAERFGIRLLFVLLQPEVYVKPEWARKARRAYSERELKRLPPHRRRFLVEGRLLESVSHFFKDPDALKCQRDFLLDLLPRLRGAKAIFAYELVNEVGGGEREWTREMASFVRRLDPGRPVGMSSWGEGLFSGDPVVWAREFGVDFVAYHDYPSRWHGHPATPESDYGTDVAVAARYARLGGKPVVLGECGGNVKEFYGGDKLAHKLGGRDSFWGHVVGGGGGYFTWSGFLDEFLGRVLAGVEFGKFARRRRPLVGVDVSHPQLVGHYFSLPEGRKLYLRMCRLARLCFRRGIDFDFSLGNEGYEVTVKAFDPNAERKIARLSSEVEVPRGYEAQFLCSEDLSAFLCYLRNVAGARPIPAKPVEEGHSPGYVRLRRPVDLTLRVNLPLRCGWLRICDLDSGRIIHVRFERGRGFALGRTEHDFVIVGAD